MIVIKTSSRWALSFLSDGQRLEKNFDNWQSKLWWSRGKYVGTVDDRKLPDKSNVQVHKILEFWKKCWGLFNQNALKVRKPAFKLEICLSRKMFRWNKKKTSRERFVTTLKVVKCGESFMSRCKNKRYRTLAKQVWDLFFSPAKSIPTFYSEICCACESSAIFKRRRTTPESRRNVFKFMNSLHIAVNVNYIIFANFWYLRRKKGEKSLLRMDLGCSSSSPWIIAKD